MDILTQGLLGATLAQSQSRQKETVIATIIGFAAGLLADADVLIQSSSDPLLTIEFHRHFTHSIFFIPFGALIASLILWPFMKKRIDFKRLYVFSLLGYSLSGFLDACTSYGTHLLWPLMPERVTFNIISIVDPVFTLGLLAGVIYSLKRKTSTPARLGLIFAAIYMAIGWTQHQRAEAVMAEVAKERGHAIERGVVKPTLGNLVAWRSVYQSGDRLYVDGVRVGLAPKFYEGQAVDLFRPEVDFMYMPKELALYQDILRFIKFSDGYVAINPETPHILGDLRYSNKPLGIKPVWGIEMDLRNPQYHAKYKFYRDLSKENRQQFFDILFGRDLNTLPQ